MIPSYSAKKEWCFMGLLLNVIGSIIGTVEYFKKKKPDIQTTTHINSNASYDPWAKTSKSRNDDYAVAAFIRISERGAIIGNSNDDYARYFNYEFGVYDPIKYHKRVIADGYLDETAPDVALGKLKVNQLKSILSNAGLPAKGKKSDLIPQIIDNVDIASLNLPKYYVPSEKGKAHLKQYEYVFRLKDYGISWEEYDEYKKSCADYLKPNDIIWQILNRRFNDYNTGESYGLARNEQLYMAKLLEYEEKRVDALYHYTLVLYYDTSGCGNHVIGRPEEVIIAPAIIESIHRLKDNYDERIINRCYDRYRLPHHYIDRENFERLLFDIFNDKTICIKDYTK